MFSNSSVPTVLRGSQALFAVVLIGLSISLIRGHKENSLPTTLVFAVTVGGLSLVAALLSAAASFTDFLSEQVSGVIDGVILLLNLAGGMLVAIKFKGASCKIINHALEDIVDILGNDIICGGLEKSRQSPRSCYYVTRSWKTLERRCRESTADSTFMFLTAIMLIAVGTLTYIRVKKAY